MSKSNTREEDILFSFSADGIRSSGKGQAPKTVPSVTYVFESILISDVTNEELMKAQESALSFWASPSEGEYLDTDGREIA